MAPEIKSAHHYDSQAMALGLLTRWRVVCSSYSAAINRRVNNVVVDAANHIFLPGYADGYSRLCQSCHGTCPGNTG